MGACKSLWSASRFPRFTRDKCPFVSQWKPKSVLPSFKIIFPCIYTSKCANLMVWISTKDLIVCWFLTHPSQNPVIRNWHLSIGNMFLNVNILYISKKMNVCPFCLENMDFVHKIYIYIYSIFKMAWRCLFLCSLKSAFDLGLFRAVTDDWYLVRRCMMGVHLFSGKVL